MKSLLLLSALLNPAAPVTARFAGTWETSFGTMVLTQKGDEVTGYYLMQGLQCTIDGTQAREKLSFRYREANTAGEGWFELASDGRSFTGKWRETGADSWKDWVGRRTSEKVARKDFAGLWDSSFGRIRLVQNGTDVQGIYNFGAGGSIVGKLEGTRLTFDYKEPTVEGEGWFELAADGRAFEGKWRPKGSADWRKWNGTRVNPVPGQVWLVVIEAPWEGGLADQEYSFGQMLRAFFSRTPQVQVRHRIFTNEAGLRKWLSEVAYLAEPVVISLATHGTPDGVTVSGQTIGYQAIAESLRYADNIKLLHFSACAIMKAQLPEDLMRALNGQARFPISGYTESVDWGASAVLEFGYFDLILARGMPPEDAAKTILKLMPFAGDKRVAGAPFRSAGLRILMPETKRAKAG